MTSLLSVVVLFAISVMAIPAPAADVVTTFSIPGDWVNRLASTDLTTFVLVGPDREVHEHEVTASELKELKSARLIVAAGRGLEPWLDRAVQASGSKARVLKLAEHLDMKADPHFWHDSALVRQVVPVLAESLAALTSEPDRSGAIRRRAGEFGAELEKLGAELKVLFQAIPEERRKAVTAHAAFGALASAYGWHFFAPQGWTTEAEPSAQQIALLIRRIREEKIPAVFLESQTSPVLMKQIARETGARIGGTLYAEALSEKSGPASDYLSMMRHNATELRRAAVSTAP